MKLNYKREVQNSKLDLITQGIVFTAPISILYNA